MLNTIFVEFLVTFFHSFEARVFFDGFRSNILAFAEKKFIAQDVIIRVVLELLHAGKHK